MKFIEKYVLEKIEPVHGYKYSVKVLRTIDRVNYYNCGCGKYFKTEKDAQAYKRACEKEQKRKLKERAQLEKALKSLENCTGDCNTVKNATYIRVQAIGLYIWRSAVTYYRLTCSELLQAIQASYSMKQ